MRKDGRGGGRIARGGGALSPAAFFVAGKDEDECESAAFAGTVSTASEICGCADRPSGESGVEMGCAGCALGGVVFICGVGSVAKMD